MTTTLRTHHPDIDQRGKDTMEVIDRLLHEIQNNLQVIRRKPSYGLSMEHPNVNRDVPLMPLKTLREC
jgi:hypothetical protein